MRPPEWITARPRPRGSGGRTKARQVAANAVIDNVNCKCNHGLMPPKALTQLTSEVWTLDDLVGVANGLLPDYLPKEASGRTSEAVNPRLVRHYSTLGLVPEARKEGREARYVYEHLVHLLLVRRLLAEGFSSAAIKRVLVGKSVPELEHLLEGGVRVELIPEHPAVADDAKTAFLRRLRASAGLERSEPAAAEAAPSGPRSGPQHRPGAAPGAAEAVRPPWPTPAAPLKPAFRTADWSRIELLDGLELHVRDDFRLPTHRLGDEQISQLVKVVLLQLEQRRKARS
jgi:DNA-binding transcriptional MerR regulator